MEISITENTQTYIILYMPFCKMFNLFDHGIRGSQKFQSYQYYLILFLNKTTQLCRENGKFL